MAEVINFEDLKKKGVNDEQLNGLIEIFQSIRNIVDEGKKNKKDKKDIQKEIFENYAEITKWVQDNEIDYETFMEISSKLPKEVTEGFRILSVPSEECMPFVDMYQDKLQVVDYCRSTIDNDKNQCIILIDGPLVTLISKGKIDLDDEELNQFLNIYEQTARMQIDTELSLELMVCENVVNYTRGSTCLNFD